MNIKEVVRLQKKYKRNEYGSGRREREKRRMI
jgi:hypothetical protein